MAASVALGSAHKLMVVCYTPDSYRVDGKTSTESNTDILQRLLALLEYEPAAFERVFLCYAQENASTLPHVAATWDAVARQVSRMA